MACSTPEALGGPGASCALATDCAEGLVCITMANSKRQCSSDLAAIQSVEDAAAPAMGSTGQGGMGGGGPAMDASSSSVDGAPSSTQNDSAAPPADAAGIDSVQPSDAALPMDSEGTSMPDAPVIDAGGSSSSDATESDAPASD